LILFKNAKLRYAMHRLPIVRPSCWFLGLAIVCGPLFVGCGESKNEVMKSAEPPSVTGKDSMDYYRNQAKLKTPKATP
jgi:hypothetical protein